MAHKTKKNILFFILCYGIFTYCLALFGAVAVGFQKGFSYDVFYQTVSSVLKELYLLNSSYTGITYVIFIACTFLFTYWFYFDRPSAKDKRHCSVKTLIHFGMFLPVTLVLGLHVFNTIV